MSKRLPRQESAIRREWKKALAVVRAHSVGLVLPAVVFLAEVSMIPTQLIAGPAEPAGRIGPEERIDYFLERARKIDVLVCVRIVLGFIALLIASGAPWCRCIVLVLWLLAIGNIVASAIHFGVTRGRRISCAEYRVSVRVLSVRRSIVLSLVNYLEVLLWFAVIYRAYGRFGPPGMVEGPLSPSDAVYFSGATLFTVGYGDIVPLGGTRLLAVLEVAVGVLILAILIGRMLGSAKVLGEHPESETHEESEL